MWNRLKTWKETMTARSAMMPEREEKSLKAENDVVEHLKTLPGVISVWPSVRIPDPTRLQGAGEIDAVALTRKGLVLIETKNWVSDLELENGDVVQLRMKARGQQKSVLPILTKKENHLKRMAITMFQDASLEVSSFVVFPNPRSVLSPACKGHPHITTLNTLQRKIEDAFKQHPNLTAVQQQTYRMMIDHLGGWDTVHFEGGLINNGDIDDEHLPLGWRRNALQSVQIEVDGGWLLTMLRGLRVKITTTTWQGISSTQTVNPKGLFIKHTTPWGPSGVDGKGTHPLSHLSLVKFGNKIPFSEAASMTLPDESTMREGLSTLTDGEANRSQAPALKELYARFQVGKTVTGTVVKHLKDDDGETYALLIALVERHVRGILYVDQLGEIHPTMFEVFYRVEAPVDVTIASNNMRGKIKLTTPKE